MEDTVKISKVFQPYSLGSLALKNRVVMASLTRLRCDPKTGVPNDLHIKYYSERAASAGLILTECTYVDQRGHGLVGGPGIVTQEQIEGWKKVTQAVHETNGLIFMQLFHCGRGADPNLFKEVKTIAPSPVAIRARIFLGKETNALQETPQEMTEEDIQEAIQAFKFAAKNAKEAGFDGIEIHAANGYLVDSFIRDHTNRRTDSWGGSVENRCKFALKVVDEVSEVFGAERVGLKLSPVGRHNDMFDSDPIATYSYLLTKLSEKNVGYVQLYEAERGMKTLHPIEGPKQIENIAKTFKRYFNNTVITNGGLTLEEAIRRIEEGETDLVCFGKLFISNPDLVERFKNGWALAPFDRTTFYGGSEVGYCDYKSYEITQETN